MAPGPVNRGVELTSDVIDDDRSRIEDQVLSGVAVRMARSFCWGSTENPPVEAGGRISHQRAVFSAAGRFTGGIKNMIIKGGSVVFKDGVEKKDIRVADGKIVRIADGLTAEKNEEVIDAKGLHVFPGSSICTCI